MSKLSVFLLIFLTIETECLQLYRRDTYKQEVIRQRNWPEFRKINEAVIRHHRSIIDAAKTGQFASTSQPLYDYSDQEYNIRVSVGSPPQVFEVLPEMSTANFWVVDKKCNGSSDDCPLFCQVTRDYCEAHCLPKCCSTTMFDTSNPCQGKRQFDQDASSTYKKDGRSFDLPFGLGNVSGILGMDTVILGDPKSGQVSIPETIFAQAQTLAYEFGKLPLDGMLGLAYQSVSIDNVAPVFQHALDLKLFEEPVFTLWLSAYGIGSVDKEAGGLTFGSKDPKNCKNDAKFVDIVNKFVWWFKIDGVKVANKKGGQVRKTDENAIISLGSSMLLMGNEDLMNLVQISSSTYDFEYGLFDVPCDAQFTWSIKVGSQEFEVPSKNLIWKIENNKCLLAAASWGDAPHPIDLVLGVPFLRSFCNIFDVESGKIGFATKLNPN